VRWIKTKQHPEYLKDNVGGNTYDAGQKNNVGMLDGLTDHQGAITPGGGDNSKWQQMMEPLITTEAPWPGY
jgi:hypothetical protein